MCVCVRACVHVCVCVCEFLCEFVCACVCTCVGVLCVHACACVCIYQHSPNKKSLCQIAYSENSSIENWYWEATKSYLG